MTCKQPFTSVLVLSNIEWLRESLVWIKHKPSNFGNGKSMHLNYTEDIMVFGEGKGIYNPQRQARESTRVKEAQKGNSKKWNTVRKNDEVSFGTQYEPKDWKEYDADTKLPMNYLVIPAVVSNSNEKLDHPTQKPVALFEHLIKTYTNEGMLVLDNTAGVSTTAVASKNTNRKWICIEQEEKYCQLSKDRLKSE